MPDGGNLERLRAAVDAIETDQRTEADTLSLGDAALDAALPWGGLPTGALHQIVATPGAPGPALGFAVHLARQLVSKGPILWCVGRAGLAPALYVPALVQAGIPADALTLVRGADDAAVLWAMEEGLRAHAPALVIGAVKSIGLVAERRLQLAAGAGRTTGLLIHEQAGSATATAAVTRWRVGPLPSARPAWNGIGQPKWSLELERCRRGTPKAFTVEMNCETHRLSVAA